MINQIRRHFSNTKILSVVLSVAMSVFLVTVFAWAATTITTGSIGIATSTPGAALGVKGVALVDGFVLSDFLVATSTTADSWVMGGLGIGTTTVSDTLEKDGGLAAEGSAIFGGGVTVSYVKATSTTSSSIGRLGVSTTSPWALFAIESLADTVDNGIPIFAIGDTGSNSPMMIVSASSSVGFFTKSPRTPFNIHNGVGTSTVYISTGDNYGDVNHGGQIILKDADGATCSVIVTQDGVMDVQAITCPAESD